MNAYKDKFYQETGVKWKYQDEELEQKYIDFKTSQAETDPDAVKELMEDIDGKM